MKNPKKIIVSLWPAAAMILLILDAKTALLGAQEGLELCIRTVIPSLFPFLFLSVMLTGSLTSTPIPLLRPLGRLCRIPIGTEGLLAVGLIGGYPVGAQCIAQAYRNKAISQQTAHRMLGFCSNAGPSFLFGILSPMFLRNNVIWILWAIHILSAILTGLLLPGNTTEPVPLHYSSTSTPAAALQRSIQAMGSICGWVIIFRVILSFCKHWFFWMMPVETAILLSGLLELTNGCCQLSQIGPEWIRFLLASVMLGFGGICVWLQTVSVTKDLGTGSYIPGKLIQTGISLILSCAITPLLYPEVPINPVLLLVPVIALCLLIIRKTNESNSSFLVHQGV